MSLLKTSRTGASSQGLQDHAWPSSCYLPDQSAGELFLVEVLEVVGTGLEVFAKRRPLSSRGL
jgi:hypothetical protein